MKVWTIKKHLGASVIILIVTFIAEVAVLKFKGFDLIKDLIEGFKAINTPDSAGSIGIIGGVDGPTAIFIAGKLDPRILLIPQIVVMILLVLSYFPISKLTKGLKDKG